MTVDLGPEFEAALAKWAEANNIPLTDAVKVIVGMEVAPYLPPFEPKTDFDRRLMTMGRVGGAFSAAQGKYGRDEIYE